MNVVNILHNPHEDTCQLMM